MQSYMDFATEREKADYIWGLLTSDKHVEVDYFIKRGSIILLF